MATGFGGHKGPQEPRESQQPPVPNYAPEGHNYYYPPSTAPVPPPPPPSGYAPPPLGFRPPPPPPMGVRPPPPPPTKLRLQANPTFCSEDKTASSPEDEGNGRAKNSESWPVQEPSAKDTVVRSRWDKKDGSKASARSRWDKKDDGKAEAAKGDPTDGQKTKMKIGLGKRPGMGSISMKIKQQAETAKKPKLESAVRVKPASSLVAQAFGSDSDEDEEMPPEAKLRMRNVGRDTPTSSGPNSFYKTAKGFTDPRGSWRNELEND